VSNRFRNCTFKRYSRGTFSTITVYKDWGSTCRGKERERVEMEGMGWDGMARMGGWCRVKQMT